MLPHPHDVLMAKLERMDSKDREHISAILTEFPLTRTEMDRLEHNMPHRTASRAHRPNSSYRICT
ncbi:MAG: hypothetical protein ABIP94_22315 [Planctomycetota bacterium]